MRPPKGHSYTVGEPRTLRESEKALLIAMLSANPMTIPMLAHLEERRVQDMNDGGMGSLRFIGTEDRHFGSISMDASFQDEDSTPVFVAVILDQKAELYELDVWKVDFSPLRRIPPIEQIQIGWGTGHPETDMA